MRVHGIRDFVITGLFAFSIMDNDSIMRRVRYCTIRTKTMSMYVHLLTMHVEKRISALLPDKFALFFDGWSAGIDHYVAIFATYSQ